MVPLRRKLRVFTTTWLMFQVAWLAALVPRDCCAAHRPAAKASCHESAAVQTEHHLQPVAAESHRQSSGPVTHCRLSGTCAGPMAALFALLANHGILPESAAALPNTAIRSVPAAVHDNLTGHFEPPDPPPPRA
jgi:hypothetical protein